MQLSGHDIRFEHHGQGNSIAENSARDWDQADQEEGETSCQHAGVGFHPALYQWRITSQ